MCVCVGVRVCDSGSSGPSGRGPARAPTEGENFGGGGAGSKTKRHRVDPTWATGGDGDVGVKHIHRN